MSQAASAATTSADSGGFYNDTGTNWTVIAVVIAAALALAIFFWKGKK